MSQQDLNNELFHAVIFNEDNDVISSYIEQGADVNATNSQGMTPLMFSTSAQCTELLLDEGAKVNAVDKDKTTALMRAVSHNDLKQMKLLLDAGANPFAKNIAGLTAWKLATSKEQKNMLREAMYEYANRTSSNKKRGTVFFTIRDRVFYFSKNGRA